MTWLEQKKERAKWSQSPWSLSSFQLWDLPSKCWDQNLRQTCMCNSHSASSEKERSWCFPYVWVIMEAWHNEPKSSHPKAPEQGSCCAPSLTWNWEFVWKPPGGPCFSFQPLMWQGRWGENITSSHLSNLASKTVSTSWRTDGMYFKAATCGEHEINICGALPSSVLVVKQTPGDMMVPIREWPYILDTAVVSQGSPGGLKHSWEDGTASKQLAVQI